MLGSEAQGRAMDVVLEASPSSVPEARRAVLAFAAAHGAGAAELQRICLAVSEAVTNAVVHAYGGQQGHIRLTAAASGRALCVAVCDGGCGVDAASVSPGLGMGMGVMTASCDALNVIRGADGGTVVEMSFWLRDLAASPEPVSDDATVGAAGAVGAQGSLESATCPA